MSKLSEYSKFDHLDEDDASSNEEERLAQDATPARTQHQPQQPSTNSTSSVSATAATDEVGSTAPPPTTTTTTVMRRHPTHAQRFIFEHANNPIYEWEQTLSEVILYVPAPPEEVSSIVCTIAANHLQLGLRGHNRLFLDEDTAGAVDTTESTWCIEESDDADAAGRRKIVIYLQKVAKGSVWSSALKGGAAEAQLDPVSLQQVQKQIMLERFQEENPGMDFRDAEINGSIPDPRTFMGGVRYD